MFCIHQHHLHDGRMTCESNHILMPSRTVTQEFCNRCPVRNREQLDRVDVPDPTPPFAMPPRCVRRGSKLRQQRCNIGCLSGQIDFEVYECGWQQLPSKYHGECSDHRYHTRVMPCTPACEGYTTNCGTVLTEATACGVTVPPEWRPTTEAALQSVRSAGFDAEVYQGQGVWQNWINTLRILYESNPHAERIVILQDDIRVSPGAADYLRTEPWPGEDCGGVSLYLPHCYESHESYKTGWKRIDSHDRRFLVGAVAFVFPRWVVRLMLNHPMSRQWRGVADPRGWIDDFGKKLAVDTWIGEMLHALGLFAYYHAPSLVQHVGAESTHTKRGLTGNRLCSQWAGDAVHAADSVTGNADRQPISVVLPAHDLPDLTINALRHLRLFAEVPYHVVYVDNGSRPGTIDLVAEYTKRHGIPTTVIQSHANLGFTAAVNLGLQASAGRHVLILNNDCFIGPRCLRSLLKEINLCSKVAAAGPVTDDRGHQSIATSRGRHFDCGLDEPINKINGEVTQDYVSGIVGRLQRKLSKPVEMTAFFCTLLNKDAIQDIGGLDTSPEYAAGLGVDDDWCRRARCRGWTCRVVHDAFASHLHSETFRRTGQDREALQKIAIRKYRGDAVK